MSEKIDITGKVEAILEIQEFASGFKKQTIVIETEGKFPQKVPIEFAKEKIDMISALKVGQQATISVNIRGSESKGKYYASLSGWRVSASVDANVSDDSDSIPF
jgi:hypothetical protein